MIKPVLSGSVNAAEVRDPLISLGQASIVGLWNVTFSSGGEVVDVAFDVWHSDRTEILNDYTNPIEGNVWPGGVGADRPSELQTQAPFMVV